MSDAILATTTLLAKMQAFPLSDVLVDLRSPTNLRYQARPLPTQGGQKRDSRPSVVRFRPTPQVEYRGMDLVEQIFRENLEIQ